MTKFHTEPAVIFTRLIDSKKSFEEASHDMMLDDPPCYFTTQAYCDIQEAIIDGSSHLSIRRRLNLVIDENIPCTQEEGSVLCLMSFMNSKGEMKCIHAKGDFDKDYIVSCHLGKSLKGVTKLDSHLRLGFSVLGEIDGQLLVTLIQFDKVFSTYYPNKLDRKPEDYPNCISLPAYRKTMKEKRSQMSKKRSHNQAFIDHASIHSKIIKHVAVDHELAMMVMQQPDEANMASIDPIEVENNYYNEEIALLLNTPIDPSEFSALF